MLEVADVEKDQKDELSHTELSKSNINYSDIATKLLADRLLLTALELHCELTESGKEIPKLKEFFSNPGNFEQNSRIESPSVGLTRWSSQATLDSLDMTRYSEDGGKVIDDRIAVLEFELRKAKETINALRTNLTVASECETVNQDGNSVSQTSSAEPIKPYEQRALNFLINEYLLMYGYKLTSNTFADENENQDFEVWDDVGLNIPKPPELLHLYRESMKSSHILSSYYQTEYSQTNEVPQLISQFDQLQERFSEAKLEKNEFLDNNSDELKEKKFEETPVETSPLETVNTHFAASTSDSDSIPEHFIIIDSYPVSNSDNTDTVEDISSLKTSDPVPPFEKLKSMEITENVESDDQSSCHSDKWFKLSESSEEMRAESKNDVLRLLTTNSARQIPIAFQIEILTRCYVETGHIPGAFLLTEHITADETQLDRFAHIVAGFLCRTAFCIPSSDRENLILLIVYTIKYHQLAVMREKLFKLLFKLIKKPKDEERKAILSGVVWLARYTDQSNLVNELLPCCWEELDHKIAERRLLVTELCCALTPYLPIITRNSTLMPILQQILLDDKEDRVRISAIHSIAFIITFTSNDDKYTQGEELLFTGLQDTSASVVEVTTLSLLPVMAKWAFDIGKLPSHLIPRLLHVLDTQIKSVINQYKGDFGLSSSLHTTKWETRCGWTISALHSILPYVVMHVVSAPVVLHSIHPNLPNALPRTAFSEVCKGLCNPASFYEGKYTLGEIIRAFDAIVGEKMWPQMDWFTNVFITKLLDITSQMDMLWEELTAGIVALFNSMCAGFGKIAIDAKVKNIFLDRLKLIESKLANVTAEWPNLIVLPIYILAVLVPLQETEDIQNTLRRFLFMLPLCGCPITALEYCFRELSKFNFTQDLLITTLWEGVVHAREIIRLTVVKLFPIIIPYSSDSTIVNRIFPAIILLSNDSDPFVRMATMPVFGKLIKKTSSKEVIDKCCFQLQTFLSEPNLFENHANLVQLIGTLGEIASHVDSTFREDVILPHLATSAAYTKELNNHSRKQELFRVLLDAFSIVTYCSFTKNAVSTILVPGLRCLESVCGDSIAHREAVGFMIKEAETRTYGQESVTNLTVSSVTANVGQEMKQRMSRIFQTQVPKKSKFWKK